MSRFLFLTMILLNGFSLVRAQDTGAGKERDSVRQLVETYLYTEEAEERKRTLYPQTKILSVDPTGSKVVETPVSKSAKEPPGRVIINSRQKIVSIDLTEGAASVKIETDFSSGETQAPKHIHYLSLLKIGGQWKIVSILMPPMITGTDPVK